jgi:curved DNA-binding protein CbpA
MNDDDERKVQSALIFMELTALPETSADLNRQYRKLALKYHPDHLQSTTTTVTATTNSTTNMQLLNEYRLVLQNEIDKKDNTFTFDNDQFTSTVDTTINESHPLYRTLQEYLHRHALHRHRSHRHSSHATAHSTHSKTKKVKNNIFFNFKMKSKSKSKSKSKIESQKNNKSERCVHCKAKKKHK